MSTIAVVYKSKYGSTERYARWIAEKAGADLFSAGQITIDALLSYDTIVYGGGLHAGGIFGFSLIKKNYHRLKDKRLVVFAVGATLKKEDAVAELKRINLTPEMQETTAFYLLRGGLDYKKMNALDRFLMFLQVCRLKSMNPDTLNDDSKGVIATYGKVVDFTREEAVEPIVQYITG